MWEFNSNMGMFENNPQMHETNGVVWSMKVDAEQNRYAKKKKSLIKLVVDKLRAHRARIKAKRSAASSYASKASADDMESYIEKGQSEKTKTTSTTSEVRSVNTISGTAETVTTGNASIDRTFLKQAVCWAEILEKPVCRQRREKNWRSR